MKTINYIIFLITASVLLTPIIISELFTLQSLPKSFYFYFTLSIAIFIALCYSIFLNKSKFSLKLNLIDFGLLSLFTYQLLHVIFTEGSICNNNQFLIQCSLIGLYSFVKIFSQEAESKLVVFSIVILLLTAVFQLIKGLQQLTINNSNYNLVIGSFDNAGPYTNYLAIIGCTGIGVYFLTTNQKRFRLFSFFIGICSILFIIFLKSRTAWLAAFIGLTYLLNIKYKLWDIIKIKFLNTFLKKCTFTFLFFMTIIFVGIYIYNIKKDSANGRLFIWQNTLDLIKNKPILGSGLGSYIVKYNNQQATYFANNANDKYNSKIADNTNFAFNDWLQNTAETGIIGLLLYLFIIFQLFYNTPTITNKIPGYYYVFKTGIIVFLVCTLFSYPLQQISTQIIFYYYLAILSSYNENITFKYEFPLKTRQIIMTLLLVLIISNLIIQINRYNANKEWKEASILSQSGLFELAYPKYRKIYSTLRYNGYYLYNFGSEMSINGKPEESIALLKKAYEKVNSSDLHVYLGNSYEQLNDLSKAEFEFTLASNMVPNRFYPNYRLLKLYEKKGDTLKVKTLAKHILTQEIKIPSTIVDEIKNEMKSILNTSK